MKTYLPLLLLLALFIACKNDEPTELEKLPPATSSGKQTFGCLINGHAWTVGEPSQILVQYWNGLFYVNADKMNDHQLVRLAVGGGVITGPGKYEIPYNGNSVFMLLMENNSFEYNQNSGAHANLLITRFDTIQQCFAGQFSFRVCDQSGKHWVSVDAGRFDYRD